MVTERERLGLGSTRYRCGLPAPTLKTVPIPKDSLIPEGASENVALNDAVLRSARSAGPNAEAQG